jgi:4,5-dihydroxyphthalate decarboxylase
MVDRGTASYIALPVFPSRVFRHGFICVNRNGGIAAPKDLEGKRIGVPLYTQTAAIWIRGLLEEEYGVDLSTIHWLQGAVMEAGGHGHPSASPMRRPPKIEINGTGRSLAELLAAGEIDAILGTFVDDAVRAYPDIVRLFADFRTVERDYFRRTGIFPMMHLMVLRRSLHDDEPWVAGALLRAFDDAKAEAQERMRDANAQRYMLPWLLADLEELDGIAGGDAFPYGIEPNRRALETLVRSMHRQGFIEREIPLEELFVTLEPA